MQRASAYASFLQISFYIYLGDHNPVEKNFRKILATGKILILDGAMGTMLQARGMPAGQSPDQFCMESPAILADIHNAYIDAGSDIITTCTFGANPFKLPGGLDAADFNKKLAAITVATAREASARTGRRIFAAGNVGPSGLFAKPLGPIDPVEMIAGFARQIKGLCAAGVDLVFVETQFDLAEARAIVVAARQVCDLPIMVSMTFENGASLTGSSPEIFAATMRNLGVDVIGTNCSLGPDEMLPVVESLLESCPGSVLAEPNAGLPRLQEGKTVFPQGPEEFAQKTARFAGLGIQILGGCCGTTPEHIKMLAASVPESVAQKRSAREGVCLTSRSKLVRIAPDAPFVLIGERINPTGKPWLIEQMQKGELSGVLRLADEQIEAGAAILDVNSGAPLTDEAKLLSSLVLALSGRTQTPLGLDSSNAGAIAAAIPFYPGSCLVNSINGEKERMRVLGPICRDYGAPFILLPLKGAQLPEKVSERIAITEALLAEAESLGIPGHLVLVDILALSVSSMPLSARECLEMARWCRKQGLATTIGLSNISFGLPARDLLNATFLCMASGAGLRSCIANPSGKHLREALDAMSVLEGSDANAASYIAQYCGRSVESAPEARKKTPEKAVVASVYDAVLHGDVENILPMIENELAQGIDPYAIINEKLIPAITRVGELYETREYFLPQLVRSAETMQKAVNRLTPLLEKNREKIDRPVIVMATVEGDIHDIGKNIVSLLLGNHGFDVVDAGKDVPADKIVACAIEHKACIIGLSALMTTTMPRMEDTIKLVREKNLPIKIMIGGAAVTPAFARSIGADAYCGDAVDSVRAAKLFTSKTS